MMDDTKAEKALSWLTDNASKAAKARATREYLSEYRKSLKAILMASAPGDSVAAKEMAAYADPRYTAHLDALRMAIEDDERFRWLQVAAEAVIEVWRTGQANQRAQAKIG